MEKSWTQVEYERPYVASNIDWLPILILRYAGPDADITLITWTVGLSRSRQFHCSGKRPSRASKDDEQDAGGSSDSEGNNINQGKVSTEQALEFELPDPGRDPSWCQLDQANTQWQAPFPDSGVQLMPSAVVSTLDPFGCQHSSGWSKQSPSGDYPGPANIPTITPDIFPNTEMLSQLPCHHYFSNQQTDFPCNSIYCGFAQNLVLQPQMAFEPAGQLLPAQAERETARTGISVKSHVDHELYWQS